MKYWSPVTAVPLSSESEEKMALVESEYFIGISSYHSEQGFLMKSSQLLLRNQEIATNLEPWRTPSMKIKKILLRMNRILTKIQKMVVILVCLQGPGLGAKAHPQYWLPLNLFPNVSLNDPPPLLQKQGGATVSRPKGYTGRLVAWFSSLWDELHLW